MLVVSAAAAGPVKNIQVTLRGKKFEVEEAVTVKDVLGKMQESAGVDDGRLLFGGKQLALEDSLEELGVQEGDSLQMVPGTTPSKKKKKKTTKSTVATTDASSSSSSGDGGAGAADFDLSAMWKDAMGGGGLPGGGGEGMPDMSESMDMMANMMNSPIFKEYMSDPEKLEASRQMILQNPIMKQMLASMPGMQEILEDKDAWREAMTAAASLYENMDPEDLKKAIQDNMMQGGGGDLQDSGVALDELSEGDD